MPDLERGQMPGNIVRTKGRTDKGADRVGIERVKRAGSRGAPRRAQRRGPQRLGTHHRRDGYEP